MSFKFHPFFIGSIGSWFHAYRHQFNLTTEHNVQTIHINIRNNRKHLKSAWMESNQITKSYSSSTVSQANEKPYYDYDNGVVDDTVDDDGDGNKQKSLRKQINVRKPSTMLNTMRERRAANIFNDNYVTDAQNNGK